MPIKINTIIVKSTSFCLLKNEHNYCKLNIAFVISNVIKTPDRITIIKGIDWVKPTMHLISVELKTDHD